MNDALARWVGRQQNNAIRELRAYYKRAGICIPCQTSHHRPVCTRPAACNLFKSSHTETPSHTQHTSGCVFGWQVPPATHLRCVQFPLRAKSQMLQVKLALIYEGISVQSPPPTVFCLVFLKGEAKQRIHSNDKLLQSFLANVFQLKKAHWNTLRSWSSYKKSSSCLRNQTGLFAQTGPEFGRHKSFCGAGTCRHKLKKRDRHFV